MRAHLTKATALHVADEVWQSCDRFLFPDSRGRRHGPPRVGSWWDFTRIPGRARSHTKPQPVWETYRLVGSLQGHHDTYGVRMAAPTLGPLPDKGNAPPYPATDPTATPRDVGGPGEQAQTQRFSPHQPTYESTLRMA